MKFLSNWLDRLRIGSRRRVVILDDFFPNLLTGFRVAEYNDLMAEFRGLRILSNYGDFDRCHAEYAALYPGFASRIERFDAEARALVEADLVYLNFLNNAIAFLDVIESHQKPFVLTLYPGGGFGLHEAESDRKLDRVLASPCLRGIITTQPVTREYIRNRCHPRIRQLLIPGVVVNALYLAEAQEHGPYFGAHKPVLDLCFVAEKYMPHGANKGYPEFIEAAKRIAEYSVQVRFHVVGSFGPDDWPLGEHAERFVFHGRLNTTELRRFFLSMDAIVSPNRAFVLHPGNFDGFPTGCCVEASLCGVAVLATDPLDLNRIYEPGESIRIITADAEAIAAAVLELFRDPGRLAQIARAGCHLSREHFAPHQQTGQRIKFLRGIELADNNG